MPPSPQAHPTALAEVVLLCNGEAAQLCPDKLRSQLPPALARFSTSAVGGAGFAAAAEQALLELQPAPRGGRGVAVVFVVDSSAPSALADAASVAKACGGAERECQVVLLAAGALSGPHVEVLDDAAAAAAAGGSEGAGVVVRRVVRHCLSHCLRG